MWQKHENIEQNNKDKSFPRSRKRDPKKAAEFCNYPQALPRPTPPLLFINTQLAQRYSSLNDAKQPEGKNGTILENWHFFRLE